jgi:hypothetical protein
MPNNNEKFEKKYGKEVAKIKSQRTAPKNPKSKEKQYIEIPPPSQEEVDQANFISDQSYYPYVKISKFGQNLSPHHLINQEMYEQAKLKDPNFLPPDAFEIYYQNALYGAFKNPETEFDKILIPRRDFYGVQTELLQKTYLLAGNRALQKSFDQIINQKTDEDIEISQTLIDEQKQLKEKQKMLKIFGKAQKPEPVNKLKFQPEKIVLQVANQANPNAKTNPNAQANPPAQIQQPAPETFTQQNQPTNQQQGLVGKVIPSQLQ